EDKNIILLATKEDLGDMGEDLSEKSSYRLLCEKERIIICGNDDRGTAQGSYYLESIMNLKEAPIVSEQDSIRKPVFSPRMIHSGWGPGQYPNSQLNAIAHFGMDAIVITFSNVDKLELDRRDINDIIERAEVYGIDVYLYSNIASPLHPDDPKAEQYYEGIYGTLFEYYPKAKGMVLVGESVEFPSKDERTTGKRYYEKDEKGLIADKPSPGWWPCYDYPDFVNLIKKVIRKHKSDADIVFWIYNWGWAPEKERLELIRALPDDITLMVTFEMFEQIKREGITNVCVDYTISFEGPGKYFSSEAKVAKEKNMNLYTLSNSAGLTWDFGVVPYEPVPFQWVRRYDALLKANKDYGLSGLVESHHYGWWPSFVAEMTNWAFWEPRVDSKEVAKAIAVRDFSEKAAPDVLDAWEYWSEAIRHYVPTNEDQYGPFRIGPSYPLIFHPNFSKQFLSKDLEIPNSSNRLFENFYEPFEDPRQSPVSLRIGVELRGIQKMMDLWQKGIDSLEKALENAPENKHHIGGRMLNLGMFMLNTLKTAVHVKNWWKLNMKLRIEEDVEQINVILDELVKIAESEILNAKNTIPLVEADSRLGWEPAMGYTTDPEKIKWKIGQLERVISHEISVYRSTLTL
ncbi:MAG: hypothetical protein GX783_07230, partial [Clostridiales bacterium]|nr:hypothetical protein [Clostridiales bacterium]